MPKISKYPLRISLYNGLNASYTLLFLNAYLNLLSIFGKELWYVSFYALSTQKLVKYILQNRVYSQKHSIYSSKVLKSTLNIQKSTQKQSKSTLYTCFFQSFLMLFYILQTLILITKFYVYDKPKNHIKTGLGKEAVSG